MVGGQETLCAMFQTSNLQNTCNFKKYKDIQEKIHNAEKSFLCFKGEKIGSLQKKNQENPKSLSTIHNKSYFKILIKRYSN